MKNGNRKGVFNIPNNCIDLIDLFLSPQMRAAKAKVHRQIEQQNMTPIAEKAAKAFASIQAITMQAEMSQQKQRKVQTR